jgi:hypothetical protein
LNSSVKRASNSAARSGGGSFEQNAADDILVIDFRNRF